MGEEVFRGKGRKFSVNELVMDIIMFSYVIAC